MDLRKAINRALDRCSNLPLAEQVEAVRRYLDVVADLAGDEPNVSYQTQRLVDPPAGVFGEIRGSAGRTLTVDSRELAASPLDMESTTKPLGPPKWPTKEELKYQAELMATGVTGQAASNLIVMLGEAVPAPRVVIGSSQVDREYRTVAEIYQNLSELTPKSITVTLKDGAKVELGRKLEPKDMLNCVKLSYGIPGEEEPPSVVFQTTDEQLDVSRRIAEIEEAAKCRYSGQPPKKIEARRPPPNSDYNLSAILSGGGRGGDAEEASGDVDRIMGDWRSKMTPDEANFRTRS